MSTKTKTESATLVDSRTFKGEYDFTATEAIIDHPKYGRICICEGWGCTDLGGECYRWKHGWVISIPSDAGFDWLEGDSEWSDCGLPMSRVHAAKEALAVNGCELMHWFSGWAIAKLTDSVGL
jgi:hypothetical protein